jgi:hypothetical protein
VVGPESSTKVKCTRKSPLQVQVVQSFEASKFSNGVPEHRPDASGGHTGSMADPRAAAARATAPLRRLGAVGLALLAPVVLLVTLWPTHFLLRAKPRVNRGIEWLHARDLFDWLTWSRLEVLANVGMFMPVGLLLTFIVGARRSWAVVATCLALSAAIELVQSFMPGRVAAVLDIVANGLGALLGALTAVVIELLVRGHRARRARRASAAGAAAANP